jgi:hypothetical protein
MRKELFYVGLILLIAASCQWNGNNNSALVSVKGYETKIERLAFDTVGAGNWMPEPETTIKFLKRMDSQSI